MTFQIPTQALDTPISLNIAVKGSCSTINYKSQLLIQVGNEIGDTTEALVCSIDNYDILLENALPRSPERYYSLQKHHYYLPKEGSYTHLQESQQHKI